VKPPDSAWRPSQLDLRDNCAVDAGAARNGHDPRRAREEVAAVGMEDRDDAAAHEQKDAEPGAVDVLDHVAAVCERYLDSPLRPATDDLCPAYDEPVDELSRDADGDDEADPHADGHTLRPGRGRRQEDERRMVARAGMW
jgi:hypothetical protein